MANSFDYINRYIERNAHNLASEIWKGETPSIYLFYLNGEYEVTELDEPTEEGDWELIEEVDTDYICEDDEVAELLADWEADAEAYKRDPYAYNGVSRWDFA